MGRKGDGFGDDGGVVVRVIARVEEVVVQRPVEPVVQELHRPGVEQRDGDHAVRSPQRKLSDARDARVGQVEQEPIEDDLVVPAHKRWLRAVHSGTHLHEITVLLLQYSHQRWRDVSRISLGRPGRTRWLGRRCGACCERSGSGTG